MSNIKDNCLNYALRFWVKNNKYELYYNSDHVINLPSESLVRGFLRIEDYGYNYFVSAFKETLDDHHLKLLNKYFKK